MSGEHEYHVDDEAEPVELAQALGEWAATYVTEVSVPKLGDGGIQRLHSRMLSET